MSATDRLSQINDLASDVGDILASLRVMAGAEISGNATLEGTNIDCLARQADRMIEAIMELVEQEQRRHRGAAAGMEDRPRDQFGNLTVEGDGLKSSLTGWHECLIALRDLAEKRPITPEALDPILTEIGGMRDELDQIKTQVAAQ